MDLVSQIKDKLNKGHKYICFFTCRRQSSSVFTLQKNNTIQLLRDKPTREKLQAFPLFIVGKNNSRCSTCRRQEEELSAAELQSIEAVVTD